MSLNTFLLPRFKVKQICTMLKLTAINEIKITKLKTKNLQAFLIAFTSDFIQKLVYKYEYGEAGKMDDYVMFTLSRSPHKNWIERGQVGDKLTK